MSPPVPTPPPNGPTRTLPPEGSQTHTDPHGPPAAGEASPVEPLPDGGRYRVLPEHPPKKGGQGRVYKATDTELQRVVALKDIQPRHADAPGYRERFVAEAEVTGRLEHPGIVPVYGLGHDPAGRPYYAMRYVEGESLGEAVRRFHAAGLTGRERAVALRQLLARFVSVCQAVAFAHSKGVIHRDLKPANVMLGPFGETLVVDWGMARPVGVDEPGGTPEYWAPEQSLVRRGRLDERTDVYGLGGILFNILTARPPHPGRAHADDPPSPKDAAGAVDDELDGITRKALAVRPDDRHPTALELAKAVEEWLADQPVIAQRQLVRKMWREAERRAGNAVVLERLARETANLGLMLAGMGRDEEAAGLLGQAAAGYERLNALRPEPRLQAEQANSLLAAARSLERTGGEELAEVFEQRAAHLLRLIIATSPDEFAAEEASIMLTHHGFVPPAARPAADPPPPAVADPPPPTAVAAAPTTEPATLPPVTAGPPAAPTPPTPRVRLTLPPDVANQPMPDLGGGPAGGFTPVREIGRGGMGSVILAWDHRLARLVAIKVLRTAADVDPAHRARFRREVRLTASLEHPNVVRVYSAGERADGSPYMVMEYLPGVSLSQRLREGQAGWTADRLEPFAQVCDALHFAHTHGVLHHDPKPANVIVAADGRAVLHDWGLARRFADPRRAVPDGVPLAPEDDPDDAAEGYLAGTPVYMSPEQARGDTRRLTPASDLFSVGAGLFEAVAGRTAVQARHMAEALSQVLDQKGLGLRDVRPDVPPELDAIISKAMAFRPEDRYQSAAELAADLRAFLTARC